MANEFVARKGIISLGGLTFPYLDVPSTYTAGTDDYYLNIVSSGVVLNLPTAVGIQGKQYVIKNSTSVGIIIDAFSTQTIDNSSIITLGADDSVQLASNGTGWKIVNMGSPISGATNNALLISDGSVGGVRANSNLTYDGSMLKQRQVSTATTYSEVIPVTFTGVISYTGVSTNVFSISKTNLQSITCQYALVRGVGRRSGRITGHPTFSSTASTTWNTVEINATQIGSRLLFTSDTSTVYFYVKLPDNWASSAETINGNFVVETIRT